MIDKKELFLGKCCKLERTDKFILYGYVREVADDYLVFETRTGKGIISWSTVVSLVIIDERRF